jgi:flagellar biosynthesis protein FliR
VTPFEVYKFNEAEIALFGLMLIRIASCLITMPITGSGNVPGPAKVLLSLVVTLVLFPLLQAHTQISPNWKDEIILLAAREALLGVFMGFLARVMFIGIEMAGQMLGFSVGFSASQVINPTFGESSTMMEQFQIILGTLLFLTINGHHLLFEALYQSFDLAPLAKASMSTTAMASVTDLVQKIFVIAIKLAAPMIAVVLFLNIALGMVGRAVPQVNVFIISFPVTILAGFFVLGVSIPLMLTVMETDFIQMGGEIFKFIRGF